MFASLLVRQALKITRIQICAQSTHLVSSQTRRKIPDHRSQTPGHEPRWGWQDNLRYDIMKNAEVDWTKIRDESFVKHVLRRGLEFKGTFATAVFLALSTPESFPYLRKFVDHVRLENLAVGNIISYMKICDDPDELVRCWEHLESINAEFTERQAVSVVQAMQRTPEWRQSLKLMDLNAWRGQRTLSESVAEKFFEEKDIDEGIQYLRRGGLPLLIGSYAESLITNRELAGRFLEQMTSLEAFIDPEYDLLKSVPWKKHFVARPCFFSKRRCSVCLNELPAGELSAEDFAELREATLSAVVDQGDIYLGSTPDELNRFQSFVENNGPFDVVIDGLNLYYKGEHSEQTIKEVCKEYVERGSKRILIIMREHIRKRYEGMNLPPEVQFYCVADISKDDPYLLLAALMSHQKCRMLTTDFFRDHLAKLKRMRSKKYSRKVYTNFVKWMLSHKDHCATRTFEKRAHWKVLRPAPRHFLMPHADSGGWHFSVPFRPGFLPEWICIRRKSAGPTNE